MTALAFVSLALAMFLLGFVTGTVGWVWWVAHTARKAIRLRETQTLGSVMAGRSAGRVQ